MSSSQGEKKARAAKRFQKKHLKSLRKNKRKFIDGSESDENDDDEDRFLPTPAQLLARETGNNAPSLKRKRKIRKEDKSANTQRAISIESLPVPDFSSSTSSSGLHNLRKSFWTGPLGQG